MKSDAGARARYQKRKRKRVHIYIDNIEPQSKRMPEAARDKFQEAVADQLTAAKRSTFAGDVALKIDLATTSRNAPQAHTIAKNLLDLLGVRRPNVPWPRQHLLYKDDRQIQALSVSCRHGETHPAICIEARPFTAMLDDLELAAEAARAIEMNPDYLYEQDREADWIKTFRNLKENEADNRRLLGNSIYDAYLKMTRWHAQRALLKSSGVATPVLHWMYGHQKGIATGLGKEVWAELVGESMLRLQVGELPIAAGSSEVFKQKVLNKIADFKKRWDWLITPLVVAVALEVVIRPNPATPPAVLHDLDNIVRDYLLPGIVPEFGTVSDHRWTIDFDELQRTSPEISASWGPNPTPPPGTKSGVTRYEAWRLPAVANEPGFVSVALIADVDGNGDRMDEIDKSIDKWARLGGRQYRY
ncbi:MULTISPECIES: hypothetical protein [unclassified Burkholderia]|uniref:hypothetical protein n=1 Tax=unclassified Burkholderia TaxID=2613784 RepID=UPI000B79B0BC|nr:MULTISPECIES: hypothetical protein [unclassified Burkholderia]MCA8061266.1 hypothetical protein [Burkholderia sp. AU38729]OXI19231.1 hypothetical protein CFB43_22260 [Burkholderia sp. AU15512]